MSADNPISRIRELVESEAVLISHHARVRMFERNISTDDLFAILADGEVIEEYTDSGPCPSALVLGFISRAAYHVVVALCADHLRIITVYIPEEEKWMNYRTRRKES